MAAPETGTGTPELGAPETDVPETGATASAASAVGSGWLGRPERSAPTSPKTPIRMSAPARNQPTGGQRQPEQLGEQPPGGQRQEHEPEGERHQIRAVSLHRVTSRLPALTWM